MKMILLMGGFSLALAMLTSCDDAKTAAKDTGAVVDYATGATAVKAKKNAESKLQKINQQHNQDVENALK